MALPRKSCRYVEFSYVELYRKHIMIKFEYMFTISIINRVFRPEHKSWKHCYLQKSKHYFY